MSLISYEDFSTLDIRIGRIESAEPVEGTDRLVRLEVDTGDEIRTLVAGIAHSYSCQSLPGRLIPVLINLEPRKIRGILSQGMILAADSGGSPVLMHPDTDIEPGSKIK
jgi:methionine--tRNA ligase beta chain